MISGGARWDGLACPPSAVFPSKPARREREREKERERERERERGVRRNQIGHSLGIERRRYFGCNCDQISLNDSGEIKSVTFFFSKFDLPFECGKNKLFNL